MVPTMQGVVKIKRPQKYAKYLDSDCYILLYMLSIIIITIIINPI